MVDKNYYRTHTGFVDIHLQHKTHLQAYVIVMTIFEQKTYLKFCLYPYPDSHLTYMEL